MADETTTTTPEEETTSTPVAPEPAPAPVVEPTPEPVATPAVVDPITPPQTPEEAEAGLKEIEADAEDAEHEGEGLIEFAKEEVQKVEGWWRGHHDNSTAPVRPDGA